MISFLLYTLVVVVAFVVGFFLGKKKISRVLHALLILVSQERWAKKEEGLNKNV